MPFMQVQRNEAVAMELESDPEEDDRKPAAVPRTMPLPTPSLLSSSSKFKANFSGFLRDEHRYPIFGVAWSNDFYTEDNKYYRACASVAGPYATIYQIEVPNPDPSAASKNNNNNPQRSGKFILKQGYFDSNKNEKNEVEEFYCCAFGGRSFSAGSSTLAATPSQKRIRLDSTSNSSDEDDNEQNIPPITELDLDQEPNGPEFLCVGGKLFQIKIIDTVRQQLWMTLSGHGDEITALKFSPVDCHMLLSTSNDRSIRIWNVSNGTCTAILAGHHGHKDIVMFASWHCTGERIVSSGHDNTIKIWDVGEGTKVQQSMKESYKVRLQVHKNKLVVESKSYFNPVIAQFPIHSTNHLHCNPVDCVEFLGDLVLSKGEDKIILWEPDFRNPDGNPKVLLPPPCNVTALKTMILRGVEKYQMFYRFCLSPSLRHVAVGNADGDVLIYEVEDFKGKNDKILESKTNMKFLIRMTSFSPDGKILLCGGDGGMVLKFDCCD